MTTVQIATVKGREESLKLTVESLYDQVDRFRIALNLYDEVPDFLKSDKIIPTITDNKLMDGYKFLDCDKNEGYILICDDDILYPPDFVEKMKVYYHACLEYSPKVICSIMGANLAPRPMSSYARVPHEYYGAFNYQSIYVKVDMVGMCGAITHSDYFKFSLSDIKVLNSDLNVSLYCKNNGIGRYVVPKTPNWCIDLMRLLPDQTPTMWTHNLLNKRDKEITDFINLNL